MPRRIPRLIDSQVLVELSRITPDIRRRMLEYAARRVRMIAEAGCPVSSDEPDILLADAIADTLTGVVRWDRRYQLSFHLCSVVRTRTWNQIVRAKHQRRVPFEIVSDQGEPIALQHAAGCHAPPQPDALLAIAHTTYKLFRTVRRNITRDVAALTILEAYARGVVKPREVMRLMSYVRNASGRPFVSAVEWGGRGSQRQYRMELGYETMTVPIDDYRSGTRLSLDRRVHDVTVKVLEPGGTFATRWSYRLDYTASPAGAAFYLTGVTRTFGSGTAEPTQRFEYDFGSSTIASATLVDVPALNPALVALGGTALQPDKAGVLDLEDDGLVDFEVAKDQTLVHQQADGYAVEALPTNSAAITLCRPPVSSTNLPRALARMTPDAPVQVFRTINNAGAGTTRLLVCDR